MSRHQLEELRQYGTIVDHGPGSPVIWLFLTNSIIISWDDSGPLSHTLCGTAVILKEPQNGLYRPKPDYGSGTRILRIDDFYGGHVADPLIWQRVRLDDNTVRKHALTEDDVVINRVNSRPFLGKSAILPRIDEASVFESNMMRLTVNSDRILPKLLIAMLQIESARQRLPLNAKDAINQSSINESDVRELPVIVPPPLALQSQFAAATATARNMVAAAETASNTSSTLKASLVSRLLYDLACPGPKSYGKCNS